MIAALPADFQMTPFLPWWLERALLVIAGVWFVNLVNFMDGLDWMTVVEIVPVTGGLVLARLARCAAVLCHDLRARACSAR